MKTIDKEVLDGYNAGIEKDRLHKGIGLIEFERTKEILREQLPPAPAVVYDIGGGYGEYSYFLTELGYEVHLFDIAKRNIEMSFEFGNELKMSLKAAEVADARSIQRPDHSADAVLLFGPLYHIVDHEERQLCLKECFRLLKPDGLLFTAAISRYSTILKYILKYDEKPLLDDPAFFKRIEDTVQTGIHTKKPMGLAYFHKPDELKNEVEEAGFSDTQLRGIICPAWMVRNIDEAWKEDTKRNTLMQTVRLLEREESLLGLSTHFIGISKKQEKE